MNICIKCYWCVTCWYLETRCGATAGAVVKCLCFLHSYCLLVLKSGMWLLWAFWRMFFLSSSYFYHFIFSLKWTLFALQAENCHCSLSYFCANHVFNTSTEQKAAQCCQSHYNISNTLLPLDSFFVSRVFRFQWIWLCWNLICPFVFGFFLLIVLLHNHISAGLCALSISNDNCYLAYPGSATIGEVQVFDTVNLVGERRRSEALQHRSLNKSLIFSLSRLSSHVCSVLTVLAASVFKLTIFVSLKHLMLSLSVSNYCRYLPSSERLIWFQPTTAH